jgi:hypothetical protein
MILRNEQYDVAQLSIPYDSIIDMRCLYKRYRMLTEK